MTKKFSKSKMTNQTALSYGSGKTTLGKMLVAASDKGVVSILIDGSNAKLLTDLQSYFS
jgi:ABC-type dipeptide/oligopeptide/nickel transport system ATPase subunit